MRTIANYMPFNILCEVMRTGEVVLFNVRHVRIIGIKAEAGIEDINSWLITIRDKYGEIREVHIKTT
jgi:hypothetical protein